jgi:tetratricopeptide (TPR) repeat protein
MQRFGAFDPQDPIPRQLVERGRKAAKNGRFQEAHDLLGQAEEADIAAANQAMQVASQRLLRAAAARATRGEIAMTELDYLAAAEHFRAAAEIVPSSAVVPWAEYVNRQADALTRSRSHRWTRLLTSCSISAAGIRSPAEVSVRSFVISEPET